LKSKLLNITLILTSLVGYLEWGKNSHIFLFQAEAQILATLFTNPSSVIHPLILLPIIAQLLLVITLFQKQTNKVLTYWGIAGLSILLGFMFIIGLLKLNFSILCSTLPFHLTVVVTIYHFKKVSL
jgi:hypothetical protein